MEQEPSRDLDVEVARRVCHCMVMLDPDGEDHTIVSPAYKVPGKLPHYSTNNDDAYLLINMLQGHGYFCRIGSLIRNGILIWKVTFFKRDASAVSAESTRSLAHAACLASLDLPDTA